MSSAPQSESQFALLTERRFAPFFWTQFLGAGNDNVFKFAFTILVTFHAAEFGGGDPKTAAFMIGAVFIAPFLLFSASAGQLADKFEKSLLIRMVKNLEIAIMLVAAAGFVLHAVPWLYAATFLMGLHSTLFGPVKYAYLPQHLRDHELSAATAWSKWAHSSPSCWAPWPVACWRRFPGTGRSTLPAPVY